MNRTEKAELIIEANRAVRTGEGLALRLRAGLSRSQMAELIGCGVMTLFTWEKRSVRPYTKGAVLYAQALRKLRGKLGAESSWVG